jgi:uncharacterized membrane protein HdeD (DUF308 family)
MNSANSQKAAFSIPSVIAVVAAIFSFKVGAFFGLLLAALAIVAGIIGILLSLSPKTRGGMISGFGIIAGLVGVIAAVIKAIQWMFNM